MLALPLWLTLHPSPDEAYASRITTQTNLHGRTLGTVRQRLVDARLLETRGTAGAGRGTRVTHHLTPTGRRFGAALHNLDEALRAHADLPSPNSSRLDDADHPILEFERANSWSLLLHLHDTHDTPDERSRRLLQGAVGISPPQFDELRDLFLALDLLELEGVMQAGRGARVTHTLTPFGREFAQRARDGLEPCL